VLAVVVARSLNALALGDDAARSLGANVTLTRALGTVAVTLLCGAATAAAGPISFVGLMIPHIARWIVGPDQRWIVAYSVVGGAILVLLADVI
ncbi:iron chelate uptake ABC transporter family permease subunit, partial [Streptomyces sp. SID10244]|nr:iron chelate uptake ABC transporter family permease subunit [Streptomyces sp. SID10244]